MYSRLAANTHRACEGARHLLGWRHARRHHGDHDAYRLAGANEQTLLEPVTTMMQSINGVLSSLMQKPLTTVVLILEM